MQSKSTRGVQQDDVWGAADALVAEGLRPTIERVRQKIGRGSPNTVSPMLEVWFAGLGKRLGMTSTHTGEGQMPAAAAQALTKLWNTALLAANMEAETALTLEKHALATDRYSLSERESNLVLQEQAFTQRQGVLDELLRIAREQTSEAEGRLEAIHEQLGQRDSEVAELRSVLASSHEQLQATRNRSDEQVRRHTEERGQWEARAVANERRLLAEIDRERQTAKQANAALAEATNLVKTTRANLELSIGTLTQRLQASEVEHSASRQALASTEQRCTELAGLLQGQRTINASTLEQLNQTLTAMVRKSAPPKRKTVATGRDAGK